MSNFYGAKPGWKGYPTITFTFVEPTNVDDLHKFRYFEFERETRVGS